ncbi:hypothetical protein GGR44_001914 [Sphingobium fontiphilum]|uniref:Uncharacterized protein n=1 Tax=Sphingobium fontiphilum TaxID=944425 RepID=A0A7W6DFB2_9SPHN|nr:hypothetical protein [Sphingobium fontiphilum]MBB3982251.1 hypothetical protein [Sphingobium fontiphilum]
MSLSLVRTGAPLIRRESVVEIEAHRHKRLTPIDLAATRDLLDEQAHLWRLGYERWIPALDSAQMRDLRPHVGVYAACRTRGRSMIQRTC